MNPRIEKEEVQMRNIIRILHERISDLNKKFRDICDPLPPSKPEYADNLQQESGSDQYVQIGNTISHVDGSQIRDDEIYRSIFGMSEIPSSVRKAGIGGVDKYSYLDGLEPSNTLKNTLLRLDKLTRMTYVQSKSFDDVAAVSKRAGDMASCIPAIPPIVPDASKYNFSSPFGYRTDPFTGEARLHSGVDLAMKVGNPVYATGDAVVEAVNFDFFGYGNTIILNHGFGYQTLYAHLNSVNVIEGMKVKRGDCIAETGQSGRASGPHLHYEVHYKGEKVNPANYFDLSMSKDEYLAMVGKREAESQAVLTRRPFSVSRR